MPGYTRVWRQSENSVYAKVKLWNGDIPGRNNKDYNVATYDWHEVRQNTNFLREEPYDAFSGPSTSNVGTHGRLSQEQAGASVVLYEPFGHPQSSEVSSALDEVLLAKLIKARKQGFNAGVFIAELPQAMNMFASTAMRLTRMHAALRHGNPLAAWEALGFSSKSVDGILARARRGRSEKNFRREVANNASSYALEMAFGWAPLLGDVFAATEKLATVLHGVPRTSVKASMEAEPQVVSGVRGDGGSYVVVTTLSVRGGFTFRVSNEWVALAADIGFTNPMSILWETIPFSFAFDWLVDVGSWLHRFSATHGLEFVDGYASRKGKQIRTDVFLGTTEQLYRVWTPPNEVSGVLLGNGFRTVSPGSITSVSSGYVRNRSSSFPSNTPLPRVQLGVGLKQLGLSLALLHQRRPLV